MNGPHQLDVERVICRLADIDAHGARGFTIGTGDWPLRGFVVRNREEVRGKRRLGRDCLGGVCDTVVTDEHGWTADA